METTQAFLLKGAAKLLFDVIKEKFVHPAGALAQDDVDIQARVAMHLVELDSWSGSYQLYGMPLPAELISYTTGLDFLPPRIFRGPGSIGETLTENDLLTDRLHLIILGDPGSGKTTTIKRLIRLLLAPPLNDTDDYQYPLAIRLRELPTGKSLNAILADILGIKYTERKTKLHDQEVTDLFVGDQLLTYAIPQFLNQTRAVLFLDGLDEIVREFQSAIKQEIGNLALLMNGSKLVVSCRSGDALTFIEGLRQVEICPLNLGQVEQIASSWLSAPKVFIDALCRVPYFDVADRPLMLVQLLILFRRQGDLPQQPAEIYRKMTRLMLEDWDAERSVVRKSKYGEFGSDKKAEFLAAVAYRLLYERRSTVFSAADLVSVYLDIYEDFALPEEQASEVAAEAQSHTGIIVVSQGGGFEFSHLSLQEYLCAEYLVKEPFPELLDRYIASYPAPLAIATALSSNPSNWFAGLILKPAIFANFSEAPLPIFLRRLILERPNFTQSASLGQAIIRLYEYVYARGLLEHRLLLDKLLDNRVVRRSLARGVSFFKLVPTDSDSEFFWLARRAGLLNNYGLETPNIGALPKWVVCQLLEDDETAIFWEDKSGLLHLVKEHPTLFGGITGPRVKDC